MAVATNIRVIVPRVRRRLEGAGAPAVLTDDAVKDLVADSISSILLYTGSVFGKTLDVAERTDAGIPSEYTTSDELTLQEGTVVAAQAALDHFFFQFAGLKVSERIADEAGVWEYARSANLLKGQLDLLVAERDRALDAISVSGAMDEYVSFLAVRDVETSRLVEPWTDGAGWGGQIGLDIRFSGVD